MRQVGFHEDFYQQLMLQLPIFRVKIESLPRLTLNKLIVNFQNIKTLTFGLHEDFCQQQRLQLPIFRIKIE